VDIQSSGEKIVARPKKSSWKDRKGVVYSTNPDFDYRQEEAMDSGSGSGQQDLRVWLERRAGNKVLTVIKGFEGPDLELQLLAKKLKSACGSGGGAKDGDIMIQGDHREKVIGLLREQGYAAKKAGG